MNLTTGCGSRTTDSTLERPPTLVTAAVYAGLRTGRSVYPTSLTDSKGIRKRSWDNRRARR